MSLQIETVQNIFPEVKTSWSGGHLEYIVNCPKFHRKGGIYKLSINADTGAFMCHDCGFSGNAYWHFFDEGAQFFPGMKINRTETSADKFNSRVVMQRSTKEWRDGVPSPGEIVKIGKLEESHPAMKYLNDRGISVGVADDYEIKYCKYGYFDFSSRMGTTAGRLIFPVIMNEKLIGWQARQIEARENGKRMIWKGDHMGWWEPKMIEMPNGDIRSEDSQVPRYYTCPGMHRSKALMNFDVAKKNSNFVIVVEGPVDAIKAGKHAVATFGKKLTRDQVRILSANWSRVLMILDEEVNPEETWFKNLEQSFQGVYFLWMKLNGFEDPGSASNEDIWNQINTKYGELNDYKP